MITEEQMEIKQFPDRIYNIKGLSWMLKNTPESSAISSNNSSHIDHQFKIFKLKDEKKKWKKKIHRKFESVGEQIEANIRHKLDDNEPFNIEIIKESDFKHIPHLKKSHSFAFTNENSKENLSEFLGEREKSSIKTKNYRNSLQENPKTLNTNNKSLPSFESHNDPENQIFRLRKLFAERKNENDKIIKSKNILKLHFKQKEFLSKQSDEFFGKEIKWIDNKVEDYNCFDILEYERNLIEKRCLKNHKETAQMFRIKEFHCSNS